MGLKVAVNGFGTIGKRVADAVAKQPDLTLVGVTKTRPTSEAELAVARGYPLYVAGGGKAQDFRAAGIDVQGGLDELLSEAEVVIDASPDKIGAANREIYDRRKLPALFQGGEKASVAERSFSALADYGECLGVKRLRVVSCNTTGLARAASVLQGRFGVDDWDATLIRRAADPGESKKGPVNGILPSLDIPSHHGPDVQTVLPGLPISTTAVTVSTSLMHVHTNTVRLRRAPTDVAEVLRAFRESPRFLLFTPADRVEGTPGLIEWARDQGRPRNDLMENVLWEAGIELSGPVVRFFQAIHQESIVVPENVDALRAMFELETDPRKSIERTDRSLGLGRRGS